MSLYRDFAPDGWGPIVLAIQGGEFVEKERFIAPLRGVQPIPQEARRYLAGLIDGSIKRPRGQPRKSPRSLDSVDQLKAATTGETGFSFKTFIAIKYAYSLHHRCKRRNVKCTMEGAIQRSAKIHRMKFDSLYGQYKRAKKPNFTDE